MTARKTVEASTCECGCGRETTVYNGRPRHFVSGHAGRRPADERFWEKVQRAGDDECWPWLGFRNYLGYGSFWDGSRKVPAYRFAYMLRHGTIPDGAVLDHLCRNPSCVNPNHLEAVSHRENIKRGHQSWRKCPHGDEFRNPQNRTCQVCANARRRELRNIGATDA